VPVKHFSLEGDLKMFFNILKFSYIPAMLDNNEMFLPHVLNQFPQDWKIPDDEKRKRKRNIYINKCLQLMMKRLLY